MFQIPFDPFREIVVAAAVLNVVPEVDPHDAVAACQRREFYCVTSADVDDCRAPFRQALHLWSTVISVSPGYAVADCGLKSLGMDHGDPALDGAVVWFCSDEHITFAPENELVVGDRVRVAPAHVDPTLAYHQRIHLVSGDEVLETWDVDLRGW